MTIVFEISCGPVDTLSHVGEFTAAIYKEGSNNNNRQEGKNDAVVTALSKESSIARAQKKTCLCRKIHSLLSFPHSPHLLHSPTHIHPCHNSSLFAYTTGCDIAHLNMDAALDMRHVRTIRLTADNITLEGLTMDVNMLDPESRARNKTSSEPHVADDSRGPTTTSNPRLTAKDHANDGKFHLLLAASGSVATIKIPNIVRGLAKIKNLSIRILFTESATRFLQGQSEEQPSLSTIAQYPNVDAIYRDEDEWKEPWVRGAPILHIELRRWADLLVIAPLSANTLAKISNGICDNLLTSIIRAWQVEAEPDSSSDTEVPGPVQKRIIIAPAMNTAMWRHPLTARHLRAPGDNEFYHWFDVLRPVEKELACGDTGDGAMCDWKKILATIEDSIRAHKGKDPLGLLFE